MTERHALQLGRRIVRYTQAGRSADAPFPLTAGWIRRISRRIGDPVGRDRAYQIQHALLAAKEIEPAGSYPQRRFGVFTGFKVTLYRATGTRLRRTKSSVPGRRAWWQHPLFGTGETHGPMDLIPRIRNWKEPPEWHRGVPMIFSTTQTA